MYKQGLALNKLQRLICYENKWNTYRKNTHTHLYIYTTWYLRVINFSQAYIFYIIYYLYNLEF